MSGEQIIGTPRLRRAAPPSRAGNHAIVQQGPFTAPNDSNSAWVGTPAIGRVLRPAFHQNIPDALRPPRLQAAERVRVGLRLDGAVR